MKPHFKPGDQVITRPGIVGEVRQGFRSPTTGGWSYLITDGNRSFSVRERDLWHINSTVAKERAYARKGRSPDGDPVGGDDPGPPLPASEYPRDERAYLSGFEIRNVQVENEEEPPHTLHFSDEGGTP